MSITEQLPAPNPVNQVNGRYTLLRYLSLYVPAAAPISPVNVQGVVRLEAGPYTPALTRRVFPENGASEAVTLGQLYTFSGTLYLHSAYAGAFINGIYNLNWQPGSGNAAAPLCFPDEPAGVLEAVCRQADMQGHLFSKVYPDIIFKNCNIGSLSEEEIVALPFYSHRAPFLLAAGTELALDRFPADGLTSEFELSAEPLPMASGKSWAGWDYERLVYVKIRPVSGGSGLPVLQGIEVDGNRLIFVQAPPADSEVCVLYVRETTD